MGKGYGIRAKGTSEAEIFIYEDVGPGFFGGVSAKQFADDLKALGSPKTINLRINSYGGDVFDGLAMYNLLAQHSARVVTYIDGIAASIASVIAMAGDEIRIAESGFIMIHDAWGGVVGNAKDMREMADKMDKVTGSLNDIYVKRTRNSGEQVAKWMDVETWFNAEEAIDNGFAGAMEESKQIAAHVEPSKMPEALDMKNIPHALNRPLYDAAKQRLQIQLGAHYRARLKGLQTA